MAVLQIASNATNAKLFRADRKIKLMVSDMLSYEVDGAEYISKAGGGGWSGVSSFFKFSDGSFPAGFVHFVRTSLEKKGHVVQIVRKPLPEPMGQENPKVDRFPEDDRYDYQAEAVRRLIDRGGMIAQIATGGGKCFGIETPILMHDGAIKNVEDVENGDIVMGPCGDRRVVSGVTTGRELMYRVTPVKGAPYVVNESHILSLKISGNRKISGAEPGSIVNMSVCDYIKQTSTFKHVAKGWRSGVDFDYASPVENLPPYILGAWLGDGHKSAAAITNCDFEVVDEWTEFSKSIGLFINTPPSSVKKGCPTYYITGRRIVKNTFLDALRKSGVFENKHIPHEYKATSRENRLEILAGILDTDGYLHHNHYDVTSKYEVLANDIAYVARSLGFAAYVSEKTKGIKKTGFVGKYWSVTISGNVDEIPCRVKRRIATSRRQRKDVLKTGISLSEIGVGDYYGFEVDKDSLFLLGDFTVVHNTRVAKLAYKRIQRPTLFLTTRGVLMHQMKNSFEEMGEKVGVIGDGELKPSRGFNVGMVQTFAAMLRNPDPQKDVTKTKIAKQLRRQALAKKILELFEFVILEEAHEVSGNSYFDILKLCKNAEYRLALTATPFMKDSAEGNMRLMASVGSIGIKVTEKLLIDRGILAKPIFKIIDTDKPARLYKTTGWQKAYKIGIVENTARNAAIIFEVERAIKYGMPIMILVQHKAHGEILKKGLVSSGISVEFIYGKHEQSKRQDALKRLGTGDISVLIGSTILDVGVDVPALGMVVLAGGGKAEVALRQRIGRGLRAKKSGPNIAHIVDFSDSHNKHLKGHSLTRRAIIDGTKGFSENILPVGKDFDFEKFLIAA